LGYVIAAYTLVLGTLLVYGLWLQRKRRELRARGEPDEPPEDEGEARR
jgi:hypothetical protein